MTALTRFVLRHKALVALFWLVVAAVGLITISGTTHRMTNNFAMPAPLARVLRIPAPPAPSTQPAQAAEPVLPVRQHAERITPGDELVVTGAR